MTGTCCHVTCEGADILRLSRQDLIQICGVPDGIRLYNALHVRYDTISICTNPCISLYLQFARCLYIIASVS